MTRPVLAAFCLAFAMPLAAQDQATDAALEDLDARARTFDDVDVHLDGVARTEVGDVAAQVGCIDGVENVHVSSLSAFATGRDAGYR